MTQQSQSQTLRDRLEAYLCRRLLGRDRLLARAYRDEADNVCVLGALGPDVTGLDLAARTLVGKALATEDEAAVYPTVYTWARGVQDGWDRVVLPERCFSEPYRLGVSWGLVASVLLRTVREDLVGGAVLDHARLREAVTHLWLAGGER